MTPEAGGAAASTPRRHPIFVQLLVTTPIRILLNTSFRMVYPFLPAFSRGLGVPVEALTGLLSLRSGLGLASPVFGLVPDRFGRRAAMLIGLLIFSLGAGLVVLFPSFAVFAIALIVMMAGKLLFDPSLLAHVGDSTPYARRGLAIGVSEIGWSGATLIGIPLIGVLIARGGWAAPFPLIAGLGLAAFVAVWRVIPPGSLPTAAARPLAAPAWRALLRRPAVLSALSIGPLTSIANESLNVAYGAWLEGGFGLTVAALGLTAAAIGAAELIGEAIVMLLSDRLGKVRLIQLGVGGSALAYLALPWLSGSLAGAVAGLFMVYLMFETTIVASIPFITEIAPGARATVVSTNVAFQSIGRMAGAALGGAVFRLGIGWTGALAAGCNLILLVLLVAFVREAEG